jgi:hypothetical protein
MVINFGIERAGGARGGHDYKHFASMVINFEI